MLGVGSRVQGAGCWVQGAGCRVQGPGFIVWEFRVHGLDIRVYSIGRRVQEEL